MTGNPKYPEIAEDYAKTFRILKSLPCDVFLSSHASFFDGLAKADRLRKGAKENPFVDPRASGFSINRQVGMSMSGGLRA